MCLAGDEREKMCSALSTFVNLYLKLSLVLGLVSLLFVFSGTTQDKYTADMYAVAEKKKNPI